MRGLLAWSDRRLSDAVCRAAGARLEPHLYEQEMSAVSCTSETIRTRNRSLSPLVHSHRLIGIAISSATFLERVFIFRKNGILKLGQLSHSPSDGW